MLLQLLLLSACTPNQELAFCKQELIDIADSIQFSVLENPGWETFFTIDGIDVSTTLYRLATKMEEKMSDCPCIGTCTRLDMCDPATKDVSPKL